MMQREGERLLLSGAVTLGNVAALLDEGRRHIGEGVRRVDLGAVTELDSALLALLLAWLREARAHDATLEFERPPEALRTIARLYGVDTLIAVGS